MSLVTVLFSFRGRTRRLHYWLASVGLILASVVATVILHPNIMLDPPPPTPLAVNLFGLLLLYPATAVCMKRIHDIGWSPAWAWALAAVSAVFAASDIFRPFGDPLVMYKAAAGSAAPMLNVPNVALVVGMLIAVVLSIIIGCIRSVDGSNAHGPSPLAAAA